MSSNTVTSSLRARLGAGLVIPAHPLALDGKRQLDERRQRALTRYYLDAGAGGLAVGVHTTQFAIRDAGLYEPVLAIAADTVSDWSDQAIVLIAGLVGDTNQALAEAGKAADLGYHAGLLSLAAMSGRTEDALIEHCRAVADVLPVIGFYLQPAVGGIALPYSFWRRFAEIENVVAIKAAPFNRYATLDVLRGVVDAGAENRIALYTGNDDHILLDLLVPFALVRETEKVRVRFVGGLLGHWSVWVNRAVAQLRDIKAAIASGSISSELLELEVQITDCNAAFFDVANQFQGCIAGMHEVLRRQGLLEGIWCLDPDEGLGPGQQEEIDRVYAAYPWLNDDEFVRANLGRWLS
jgi:hypothetical protein